MSENLKPAQMKPNTTFGRLDPIPTATVTIVDSLMGSGKTSWALQYMESFEHKHENIIYVTPFLDEIDRIKKNTTRRHFFDPRNYHETKLSSLKGLLEAQEDVATTHELFKHLDHEAKDIIKSGHYTLILDEVLDVVDPIDIKKDDITMLKEQNCISMNDLGEVSWNEEKGYVNSRYNDVKLLARNHSLVCVNNTMLLWRYPADIFHLFDRIYILTYLFEGSVLKYYFDLYDIDYEKKSIRYDNGRYNLVSHYVPLVAPYSEKIEIYEGNLNTNFQQKDSGLSSSWYNKDYNSKNIRQLKNNFINYFRHVCEAKAKDVMWTTFEKAQDQMNGRYKKAFVPCNARSTNDFSDRKHLAYMINKYVHPGVTGFFGQNQIRMDDEKYAVSEMLQWIWRSRIRNDEDITIYLPSSRMRRLLEKWLD